MSTLRGVKVYTPQEQRLLLMSPAAGRTPLLQLVTMMNRESRQIDRLAFDRCLNLGVEEYGDTAFHYSTARLKDEIREEFADAVFYQRVYNLRRNGALE